MSQLDSWLSKPETRAHLIGCGGAGMRALAEFASDLGWRVSGSDAAASMRVVDRLRECSVDLELGHAAQHVPAGTDLVVHSPAVPDGNVERQTACARGLPDVSYPEVLGAISRRWPTIAVTGTHGKSTTTALIGTAMSQAGLAGAVLCGAEVLDKRRHGWAGAGRWGVLEACEYRRHFLEVTPEIAVILGIEPDHFDCFPELEDAVRAYRQFLEGLSPGGLALLNLDPPASRQAWQDLPGTFRVETLSTNGGAADWTAAVMGQQAGQLTLEIEYRGRREGRLSLPLLGAHHSANALAAFAALRAAGVDAGSITQSFQTFGGLGRRLERHPDWRGVVRYDDYAHHPTAVRAVLEALLAAAPASDPRRLVCVFQPHQISRTERLAAEFAAAVSISSEAWILPVYAARESGLERAHELSQRIAESVSPPCRSRFLPTLDHALRTLETALRPGDIFVTLGAGDIDCLHYELPRRFP